jgi:hypothetical protein
LLVNVLVVRRPKYLLLVTDRDFERSVVLLGHASDSFEERSHLPPLDVAAGMSEELLQGVALAAAESLVHRLPHCDRNAGRARRETTASRADFAPVLGVALSDAAGKKKPDSDGDTLGLATLRTAVSVGQGHSLISSSFRQVGQER